MHLFVPILVATKTQLFYLMLIVHVSSAKMETPFTGLELLPGPLILGLHVT